MTNFPPPDSNDHCKRSTLRRRSGRTSSMEEEKSTDKNLEKSLTINAAHLTDSADIIIDPELTTSFRTPVLTRKRYYDRNSQRSMSSIQFISDAGAFENLEDSSYESISTSAILRYCKTKVLKPYFRLLSILGWRPLISQTTLFQNALWARLINWCYSALILSLIITGYVLQYSSCYRQDGYRPYADPEPKGVTEPVIKPIQHNSIKPEGVDSTFLFGKVNNDRNPVTPFIHSSDPTVNVSTIFILLC